MEGERLDGQYTPNVLLGRVPPFNIKGFEASASSSNVLLDSCVSRYTRSERPDQVRHRIHPRQPPNKRKVRYIASWRKLSAFQDHALGGAIRNTALMSDMGTINAPTRYRTQDRHRKSSQDLARASVGATIGLREAQKWRGMYACGVIVKGAAIRAEREALRRGGTCRCGHYVGELREQLRYGACGPLTQL